MSRSPLCSGPSLWRTFLAAVLAGLTPFTTAPRMFAGDLLRGGSTTSGRPSSAESQTLGSGAAAQANANARDALARTTQAIAAVRKMQDAARAAAQQQTNLGANPNLPGKLLPNVPNGLGVGGLQVAPGVPLDLANPQAGENSTLWIGAKLPKQKVVDGQTIVTIKQTDEQAVLNWETFNLGSDTTLRFDQSKGGDDFGKWIAFNLVSDPSGRPSQILGAIQAPGQVYVINGNGIIFGGGSQINTRTLVASSLPINPNLAGSKKDLLQNPDAQFLFSALTVPGGSDGTTTFVPPPALTPDGQFGDVTVLPGAVLQSNAGSSGNGGRIMLVAPNVTNAGEIQTEAGQTILAAGLQVGIAAHASDDPSLRGLDVWVGAVGDDGGTVTNRGLIEAMTGAVTMVGRHVNQLGAIESSSSVALNGRIDLRASYGAVSNPEFDNQSTPGFGGPVFFNQFVGVTKFGEGSSTSILPEIDSDATAPGFTLPEKSQINVEGRAVYFAPRALMLAPNADVAIRAGTWLYQDTDGDRTTLNAAGSSEGIENYFAANAQRFVYAGGQIYVDDSALISVAGSTDVAVPLSQNLLTLELRGTEFADSPLQRTGVLAAVPVTVDLRNFGSYNGEYWIGTPLGDVTGFANLIERNAGQLTVAGGNLTLHAGGSIVVQKGATLDVAGGYFQNEGGMVQTTRLMRGGRLVNIADALPNVTYDGIYTGETVVNHDRWGVAQTFTNPLLDGAHWEDASVQGANGGKLALTAPSMALDGDLRGGTVNGPRQRAAAPALSELALSFSAEKLYTDNGAFAFLTYAPTPPAIRFGNSDAAPADPFSLVEDEPAALRADRVASVVLSPDLLARDGFGKLTIDNVDGSVAIPKNVAIETPALGALTITAANLDVRGDVTAPGGALSFNVDNLSPSFIAEFKLSNPTGALAPPPNPDRGLFSLGAGAELSTAGLIVDDRVGSDTAFEQPLTTAGGSVSVLAYSAQLAAGSGIDVSGGAVFGVNGSVAYGDAGGISVRTGKDPELGTVLGGTLTLGTEFRGFSGGKGGSLALQTTLIQVGGAVANPDTLVLTPAFFQQGGFASYALTGIGASTGIAPGAGELETYFPAIAIEPGVEIRPVTESWLALGGPADRALTPTLEAIGQRTPASVSFAALGADDSFTTDQLEVRGDIVMGRGASIVTDPGAAVAFNGQTVTLRGTINAPGGSVTVAGASQFPFAPEQRAGEATALPTVYLAREAAIFTQGTTVLMPDAFGRRLGSVWPGGSINVTGNIVAARGSVLDVSGAEGVLDYQASYLGEPGGAIVPAGSGVNAPLWSLAAVPVEVASNGGTLSLTGSEMLFTDATLRGDAGGATAVGGMLAISSGRFYGVGAAQFGSDLNLVVTQSGPTIATTNESLGIGQSVLDAAGAALSGMGYFAVDRFARGGFASLDLGYSATGINGLAYGGNVEFRGPVSIAADGMLRVAAGGILAADGAVNLTAPYVALGQVFRAPPNPSDPDLPFRQNDPAHPGAQEFVTPTFGAGSVTVTAEMVDIGTLVTQGIGQVALRAPGGDLRGNGTLSLAGDLRLESAQLYPTTLSTFDIFAYDHDGTAGSVKIIASGTAPLPLSAGGSLGIYASKISQGGVLRAPIGSIALGWSGIDLDPSDATIDAPFNPVTGTTLATPAAQQVILRSGSTTSVAAVTADGAGLTIPYGVSPDGLSWIDPSGENVTLAGLPEKQVAINGENVSAQVGATVDLRGGGDLLAFRFVPGTGGSRDLLGAASGPWSAGTEYQPGDLVTYKGATWSARVRAVGETPAVSLYWTKVPDAFAVLPDYAAMAAPYAPFNTGSNAGSLGGDPGLVSTGLQVGDQIYLEAGAGLKAGTYTLLPSRYALLPGAFLVTPTAGAPLGTVTLPEGSDFVSGYRVNAFAAAAQAPDLFARFEVAPSPVVRNRAAYDDYFANAFLSNAATTNERSDAQRLPFDAGYAAFQGNAGLVLQNSVLAMPDVGGRGAQVDVSSDANIDLHGAGGAPVAAGTVGLNLNRLQSWGVESLLIGGVRSGTGATATVDVRAANLTLDNPQGAFGGSEIILAAKGTLAVTDGSALTSTGLATGPAQALTLPGDGALLRVSADPAASTTRTGVTDAAVPQLDIGAGVAIRGPSVTLDSTYGTSLDASARLLAGALTLGSGQISVVFADASGTLTGSEVDPQLVLSGRALADAEGADQLRLLSYRTIDFYGTGTFGRAGLNLELLAGGIRGYEQGSGAVNIDASDVLFSNPSDVADLAAPAGSSGTLRFDARTIRLGVNDFAVAGFALLQLKAASAFSGAGVGSFSTAGDLTVTAPLIAGSQGSTQAINATGALVLESNGARAGASGGLGASLAFTGASVNADTEILLPSGELTLHATMGDLTVGGDLNVAGTKQRFFDQFRYTGAGSINLMADAGNVALAAGSTVTVAAGSEGGDAGTLTVGTPLGDFTSAGDLRGEAHAGNQSGSFVLDVLALPDYAGLNATLEAGGFFQDRDLRVRSGSVVVDGETQARNFTLATDAGSITVDGTIDVSGSTGGKITLLTSDDLTLADGALLDASADHFSHAGKGGAITLEAGSATDGVANLGALLDLQTGSQINLGVADYVAGDYTTPGSSAFFGQFTGTLHLRAPRNAGNTDLGMSAIDTTINGASSIVADGYNVVDLTSSGGLITGWRTAIGALPAAGTTQRAVYDSASSFLSTGNYNAMITRLLGADAQGLLGSFVLAPGVEIINRTGDLTLGLTNGTSLGSASLNSADWNLSDFRFGPKLAPGVLTLRAAGDLVFNNALSDGFTPIVASSANGNSSLWLGQLKDLNVALPDNTQSWSYQLAAGADFHAANAMAVRPVDELAAHQGSVLVGQFYAAIPNPNSGNLATGVGANGLTANSIRISTTSADLGTRYEVIRTGTGSIEVAAARDVQLRNQFATIYTAGVRIPNPQNVFGVGDFRPPTTFFSGATAPDQGEIGAAQQYYGPTFTDENGALRRIPQWSFAGGDIALAAGENIDRDRALDADGNALIDSSRQLPSNWLYRSGAVDPTTGLAASISVADLTDPSVSTAWWIDYSNFFEGVGALGGGDVSVEAGNDVVNLDAVIPTNARMAGRDPATGLNLAPDPAKLLEDGGGDLLIRAGRNIDGGVYYAERGRGTLTAGGEIKTNSARSPSFGILTTGAAQIDDAHTWLPTMLVLGRSRFDVSARGDVLLGPMTNAFLLPAGLNNKPWYRTYFNTYGADASVNVVSLGGDITDRLAITLPGQPVSESILYAWLDTQNVFNTSSPQSRSSYDQPWIRLAESTIEPFATSLTLLPPTLRGTAFTGDINLVGQMTLFPSAQGTLDLVAAGSVIGLQETGIGRTNDGVDANAFASARVNVSDTDPALINGVASPSGVIANSDRYLQGEFTETGSYSGLNAAVEVKRLLHDASILHADDSEPLRVYAAGGDITGLTLFSPKPSRILAENDIADVAFYLQNTGDDSLSVVSAGRDLVLYQENTSIRTAANDLALGNFIADLPQATVLEVDTTAQAGDLQISGPGTLEALAGRNLDLGTGANLTDGTGLGLTSIGNFRNPFLPFAGADLVALAGVHGENETAAQSLATSDLNFGRFINEFLSANSVYAAQYGPELASALKVTGDPFPKFDQLPEEKRDLLALQIFYHILRDAGRAQSSIATTPAVNGIAGYPTGFAAIDALYGTAQRTGDLFTRARDIRTSTGGTITIGVPGGALTMASDIFGNPLTPPGIVTEYGGSVSVLTKGSVDIGQARIFTLRGGDITIWSSTGDIAAGTAPKTVVTAPPTRVVIDVTSADVATDLGGLATGGGIGVLASVAGVQPGDVDLIAPTGVVDAGDAGIRVTGNLNIAAVQVLNASNIQTGGSATGVPVVAPVAAPNLGALGAASSAVGATTAAANQISKPAPENNGNDDPSIIVVEVVGYGGDGGGG